MARLMSVALTEDAVRERRKTVTRRIGWRAAEPEEKGPKKRACLSLPLCWLRRTTSMRG